MKIFKDKDIGLLVRPFGVGGSDYLAVTALLCFDLLEPRRLYGEQALWRMVEGELGPGAVLDQGMPKIRSEFLAAGKCYAPRDSAPVAAAEVLVGVGGARKRLFVYGERFWSPLGGILRTEGFTEMAVSWANAFGGKGYAQNPEGKGLELALLPDGRRLRPLPNIEDPSRLMGSPDDRPEPAGFGQLDVTWPQRNVRLGTYDTRWRRERWPNPPDDFDYGYYNAAPADQQFAGFFSGDELVEIRGMHPDHQEIVSEFPPYRVRCFVTRKSDLRDPASPEEFVEAPLHAETLWLFPGRLRGVLLLRGTALVQDDAYADVPRIFLAKEGRTDPLESIEHYALAQQQALDRRVPVDPEPLRQAEKTLGAAMKQARNLPKEIARARAAVLGQSPVMERTPQEYARMAALGLGGARQVLQGLDAAAGSLRTRFGFLPLPGSPLRDVGEQLDRAGQRLQGAVQGLEAQGNKAAELQGALRTEAAGAAEDLPEAQRARAASVLAAPEPGRTWQQAALEFVKQARRTLEAEPGAWHELRDLGLEEQTIRNAWLGLHPEAQTLASADWGLDPAIWGEELSVPSGLVLPWFQGKEPAGVVIRTGRGEMVLPGSREAARLLPAAVANAPVLVAPDHLQALFLEQELGDACHILAMSGLDAALDADTAALLARSTDAGHPLVVLFPERSLKAALDPWRTRFPNARALVLPKGMGAGVFAARANGLDVRACCLEAVSPEFAARHGLAPKLASNLEAAQQLPDPLQGLDPKGAANGLLEQGKARFAPLRERLSTEAADLLEQASAQIAALGLDPDETLRAAKEKPLPGLGAAGGQAAEMLAGQAAGQEVGREVKDMAARAEADLRRELQRLEAGKQDLEANKALAKGLAARLAAQGVDPERLRQLDREEVCERLRTRQSLAGARMAGLDLSGLNFSGCDLHGADLRKAVLAGARFDHADLSRVLAQEADCREAVFRAAKLDRALFSQACLARADLRAASCVRTLLAGADLRGADAQGARFEMAVLQDADLSKANFSRAALHMCALAGAQAAGARFDHAELTKSLFRNMLLDHADFGRARVHQTMFWGVRGQRVSFLGADLAKARMGGNSVLQGADFTGARMEQACFRDADLSRALFRGAHLDGGLFESCCLVESDFYRSTAKKCRFTLCDLARADMRAMNLMQGSLRKARLVRTNLGGSNLFGVDFYKAVISGSVFNFANLKRTLLHGRTELLAELSDDTD